jgi:hypothetical protein
VSKLSFPLDAKQGSGIAVCLGMMEVVGILMACSSATPLGVAASENDAIHHDRLYHDIGILLP